MDDRHAKQNLVHFAVFVFLILCVLMKVLQKVPENRKTKQQQQQQQTCQKNVESDKEPTRRMDNDREQELCESSNLVLERILG